MKIMKINIKKEKNNIEFYRPKKNYDLLNFDYSNNINLKKSLFNSNNKLILNLSELNNKPLRHSKIYLNENNKNNTQLMLPSIQNSQIINKKMNINSSMNNIFRINCLCPIKKLKIKSEKGKKTKLKIKRTSSYKRKKKLIKIYNENSLMKEKLEKYKESEKTENMNNFSYKRYNHHLLEYSSFDISLKNFKTFKENMKIIENKLNGEKYKIHNRWLKFLEKLGKFAPEELKKKVISLSKREYNENEEYPI